MKFLHLLCFGFLLIFNITAKANFFEGFPHNESLTPCQEFLMGIFLTPPSDRTAEANNTLLFSGHNLNDLGNFMNCQKLHTHKYHILQSSYNMLIILFGFCGPSYCSTEQLRDTSQVIAKIIQERIKKDIQPPEIIDPTNLNIEEGIFLYLSSILLGTLLFITLVGTISATWKETQKRRSKTFEVEIKKDDILNQQINPSLVSSSNYDSIHEALLTNREETNQVFSNYTASTYINKEVSLSKTPNLRVHKKEPTLLIRIIECFDVNENLKSFASLQVEPNHDANLNIFHGIRALCFGWVVYGHTMTSFLMTKNYSYIPTFLRSYWFLVLVAGGFAVDVFFYLSGFFTGFLLISKLKKMPFGLKNYLKIFFHRWIRLWPAYLVAILFFWKIGVYYGKEALWFNFVMNAQYCTTNAWKNLLFLDNVLGNPNEHYCFGWGWYLSNDLQIFLLTPFLCWIYLKSPKRSYQLTLTLFFVSIIASYYQSVNTGMTYFLAPAIPGEHPGNYFFDYYVNPVVRMAPYMIGLYFGFMFKEYKNGKHNLFARLESSDFLSFLSALTGLVIILFVVFYPRTIQTGEKWSDAFAMSWGTFGRSGFVFGLFLLTAPSLTGKLKPITYFMSNRYFTLISRVSYCGYLIHYVVLNIVIFDSSQVRGFDEKNSLELSFQVLVFSCFAGLILHLLVEKPLVNIETKLISNKKVQ